MRSRSSWQIAFYFLMATLGVGVTPLVATAASPLPVESPAQRDARMGWWREARLGLFIHWGIYAVPAGRWNGRPVESAGEWIMNTADIDRAAYERLADQFNPVKYDPAAWVRLAKQAGVKYVVITSKHHDGFALFDSQVSDYDVVDRTPYAKDLLMPLADACRAEGIRFCCYHSIMDWHHPAQAKTGDRYNPTSIVAGRKAEYVDFMKAQLAELLNSCDPEILWFDGEWPDWWTEDDGRDLYAYLRVMRPNLIINNRVGKGRQGMQGFNKDDAQYVGDYGTPEQEIPATGLPGVDWESCMTMNDSWGYKTDDHNWKSTETLVRNLVDVVSKGGNYLLNVGPTAEGEIPPASVERLSGMGQWMKANAESIHGCGASPLGALPWGRCTAKPVGDEVKLFLHVFDWPAQGKLRVPGIKGSVKRAALLATGAEVAVAQEDGEAVISLPPQPVDPIDTVVVLSVDGAE